MYLNSWCLSILKYHDDNKKFFETSLTKFYVYFFNHKRRMKVSGFDKTNVILIANAILIDYAILIVKYKYEYVEYG